MPNITNMPYPPAGMRFYISKYTSSSNIDYYRLHLQKEVGGVWTDVVTLRDLGFNSHQDGLLHYRVRQIAEELILDYNTLQGINQHDMLGVVLGI